jgi:hypothetical protein
MSQLLFRRPTDRSAVAANKRIEAVCSAGDCVLEQLLQRNGLIDDIKALAMASMVLFHLWQFWLSAERQCPALRDHIVIDTIVLTTTATIDSEYAAL